MWLSLNEKNWKRNSKQRWRCWKCAYVVESKKWRKKQIIDGDTIARDYMLFNYTYRCLSYRNNVSVRTIQRRLDEVVIEQKYIQPKEVIIIMDTTYFGRKFGYMVFRDYLGEQNILRYRISRETNTKYKEWISYLQKLWWTVIWIICDGKLWLLTWFWNIPVQMCQFHQKQIITRYLTRKPKLAPSIELKDVVQSLWNIPESTMRDLLQDRYRRHKKWLWERNIMWWYIHTRTRKAYKSMIRNLPYLYTYERHKELHLPKTTNELEWWVFSWLKQKLWNHRWLTESRKYKRIEYYLSKS